MPVRYARQPEHLFNTHKTINRHLTALVDGDVIRATNHRLFALPRLIVTALKKP